MIHDIYDIRVDKVITFEKIIYAGIILLSVFYVFAGVRIYFPKLSAMYLIMMNLLVGIKVTCGFLVVFYRFSNNLIS